MQNIETTELQIKEVNAYKKGYLSLGEFANTFSISLEQAMKMLSLMGVDVIDYDLEDDMKFMDNFL